MNPSRGHRKQVKHYDEPGHCYELTFSCYRRMPLLTNNLWREMPGHSINQAIQRHRYYLFALVYMPEHVHLLVFPKPNCGRIDQLLKAIKRPFSFRIKKLLEQSGAPLLAKLTIHQRPGVKTFRFCKRDQVTIEISPKHPPWKLLSIPFTSTQFAVVCVNVPSIGVGRVLGFTTRTDTIRGCPNWTESLLICLTCPRETRASDNTAGQAQSCSARDLMLGEKREGDGRRRDGR